MKNEWKIQIWGVRGAAPAPEKEFMTYGGNTVCVSVTCGLNLIVFDAGSGLTVLGDILEKEGTRKRVDIFLSHLHLDHLMGLFTFRLFYHPEMEIHIYGQALNTKNNGLEFLLKHLIGPPYWPLGLENFPAKVFFHPLCPGKSIRLTGSQRLPADNGLTLHTFPGNHPGGSLLYRLDDGKTCLVYGLDCEINESIAPAYLNFAQNANLLLWDANFAEKDRKKGWGHSSWEQGIDFRRQAKAERILMLHYAASYTDHFLARQEALARQKDSAAYFAREKMTIFLPDFRIGYNHPNGEEFDISQNNY